MPRKPTYVPPCRNLDGKLAFIAESGKPYFLDDYPSVKKAKRAAMLDSRSGQEVAAALQKEETE